MRLTALFPIVFLLFFSQLLVAQFSFEQITTREGLNNNSVHSILEDKDGFIWIGTDEGLNRFDGYEFSSYSDGTIANFPSGQISCLAQDSFGHIWMGTLGNGLLALDPMTDSIKVFHSTDSIKGINSDSIQTVFVDSKNGIWVGTNSGLNKYNSQTNEFETIKELNSDYKIINTQCIFSICEDRYGLLWVGTEKGLVHMEHDGEGLVLFTKEMNNPKSLSGNVITSIHIDRRDFVWVGTHGDGICRFALPQRQSRTLEVERFNTKPEFSIIPKTGVIMDFSEDAEGNIWVGTNGGGILLLDRQLHIKSITSNSSGCYGLKDSIINDLAYSSSGHLWMGTDSHGINRWFASNTDTVRVNEIVPRIAITKIKLNNEELKVGDLTQGDHFMRKSATYVKKLFLPSEMKQFSIEFATLGFAEPFRCNYQYRLLGYDKSWISANATSRAATYTNLNPGHYYFEVKGTNNDGIWSAESHKIELVVVGTFLQSVIFKIIVAFVLLSLILLFLWMRESYIKKQATTLKLLVDQRTQEISKLNSLLKEKHEKLLTQSDEIEEKTELLSLTNETLELAVQQRTKELDIARKKAEESDRLKSAFLSNMSHEIRTPLNAIVGFSSLLNTGEVSLDEIVDYTNKININSEGLLRLINDIIEVSKIEADELAIEKKPFQPDSLLNDLLQSFLASLKMNDKEKLSLSVAIPEMKVDAFWTDPLRLEQILRNLIDNAIKYSNEGEIEFGYVVDPEEISKWPIPVGYDREFVLFYVKDSGIGLTKEQQELIFQRFKKMHDDKILYRGAGLGLTISKKLVELMQGFISVYSKNGEGSVFYFGVPYNKTENWQEEDKVEVKQPDVLVQDDWSNYTILIAEDEISNFIYIKNALKKTRIGIDRAANGREAVDLARVRKYELVLMDIRMPLMDGYEATKAIKEFNTEIPIIAQTAYALSNDREKMDKFGFEGVLFKPYRKDDLIEMLRRFLS